MTMLSRKKVGKSMLLAGDIGGTKTLLGLFEPDAARPRRLTARAFATLEFDELPEMIELFLREASVSPATVGAACFGVAGPVIDDAATLTNVPWRVDARQVRRTIGFRAVRLLNDLEAMAWSVSFLEDAEIHLLQSGVAQPDGTVSIIAAGTGLGEAFLHRFGGQLLPAPSEGGHADFSARTEREITLVRDLTKRCGRADVEHVVSGRGLLNIHRVAHAVPCTGGVDDLEDPAAPAAITQAALERRCAGCVETLDLFVEAYGAEAGNLAVRSLSTGGVFIGGGIAPKILPALTTGAFMRAFCAKPPLESLLRAMPVKVILNEEAGLLGAAACAARSGPPSGA
jgi:glucokinase